MKILELHAEDPSVSQRGFPAKVKSRLNLTVGRTSLQRIIKEKEKILSVPEKYRKTSFRHTSQVRQRFENELFHQFIRFEKGKGFSHKTIQTLGQKIMEENEEFRSLKLKFSENWFNKWKITYENSLKEIYPPEDILAITHDEQSFEFL